MENEKTEKISISEKLTRLIVEYKKIIIISIVILVSAFALKIFLNLNQEKKNKEISELFIKAGIYLSNNDKSNASIIFKEIINSKNKFYSILSLNNILENDLIKDNNEIINLFEIVESLNINKDHKDLLKIKKALYLKKISREKQARKILEEIIQSKSIWKETAKEILEN